MNLGKIEWKPVRYGKQVWEIGYPDRTAGKFYKGDGANYWLWGWGLRYSDLFPNDITYTIGKSDYRKDWFFEEVPHATSDDWKNPAAKDPLEPTVRLGQYPTDRAGHVAAWGRGRATTWTIKFNMGKASTGHGRVARSAGWSRWQLQLTIGVNGQTVGTIRPVATNALRYNTNKGGGTGTPEVDASLMKAGENAR